MKTALFLCFNETNKMNTAAVNLQGTQNVSNLSNVKILNEGSSVLVRVIADKGGNRYEGSVAGVRVNLTSTNPLKPGDKFVATVSSRNGVIQLVPDGEKLNTLADIKGTQIISLVSMETGELLQAVDNPALSAYLKMMGLPDNNLSLHIFQQMKQLGLKFNPALLKRMYNISLKYKGKEKRAAELLMELLQKNIDLDEDALEALLLQYDGLNYQDQNQNTYPSDADILGMNFQSMVSDFINAVFNEDWQSEEKQRKTGILAVFNHTGWNVSGNRRDNCSWCVIPFNLVWGGNVKGNGRICICLDSGLNCKKVSLHCEYDKENYDFLIEIDGKKCRKVKVYSSLLENENSAGEKLSQQLKMGLMKSGISLSVEIVNKAQIEGFSCGQEEIHILGGSV